MRQFSSGSISSWQIDGETMETVKNFIFLGSKITGSLITQLVKNLPAMKETPVQFLGREDLLKKGYASQSSILGLPCGSDGKELSCNAETWVHSLGWEDPLEKGQAPHSRVLAWRVPWTL